MLDSDQMLFLEGNSALFGAIRPSSRLRARGGAAPRPPHAADQLGSGLCVEELGLEPRGGALPRQAQRARRQAQRGGGAAA